MDGNAATVRIRDCALCGRRLKSAESIDAGIGPECRKKLLAGVEARQGLLFDEVFCRGDGEMQGKTADLYKFSIEKSLETGSVKLSFFGKTSYTMETKDDVKILIDELNRSIREE